MSLKLPKKRSKAKEETPPDITGQKGRAIRGQDVHGEEKKSRRKRLTTRQKGGK